MLPLPVPVPFQQSQLQANVAGPGGGSMGLLDRWLRLKTGQVVFGLLEYCAAS
jgi:hypothetical protein